MALPYPSPQILGQYRPVLMNRWDVGTLSWIAWDGSLTVGALTIGTVNQGTAGASPWLTTSGISLPAFDYVSNATGATTDTYTFKTGGAGGATVATVALVFTDATKATLSTVTRT